MPLKRCDNGHYFDPAIQTHCPVCQGAAPGGGAPSSSPLSSWGLTPATAAPVTGATPTSGDGDALTRRRGSLPGPTAAPSPRGGSTPPDPDGQRTERLVRKQTGIDPVVGWLVCIGGPDRGRDHRLHSERNFVGRGEGMDVRLANDSTISRENHVSLSFDPKKESFRLLPGEARGLVYLNGEELVTPVSLKAGDRIELGETVLLFVPLCGEGFRWDAEPTAGAAERPT